MLSVGTIPYPQCLAKEDKIDAVLDYVINKMGCDPSAFITFPAMMYLSFGNYVSKLEEKYYSKVSGLSSIGVKRFALYNGSVTGFLRHTKESFLEKIVLHFVDEVLVLLQLYPCDLSPPKLHRC